MPRTSGYTLVETLTVVAILAVLLAVGVPGFADTLARHRVRTAMHLVSSDLAMARSSAIMRRAQVVACPGTRAAGCRGDADWSQGWIVFADPDGNRRPDVSGDMLRISDAPAGSGSGLRVSATRNFIRYQRDGRSAGTNLTVRFCTGQMLSGEIVVSNLGRVRSVRPARATACPI